MSDTPGLVRDDGGNFVCCPVCTVALRAGHEDDPSYHFAGCTSVKRKAAMSADQGPVNAEQCAAVLEQIADHSSDTDIRDHLRQAVRALRGNGLIFLNGPPQQEDVQR